MQDSSLLKKARPIHRIVGTIIMLFTIYIGSTGLWIQWADLHAILTHAAATDPEMMAIRESIDGTGNFAVIKPGDYAAPALPQDFDFNAGMMNLLRSAHAAGNGGAFKFAELRMGKDQPLGIAQAGDKLVRVDLASGSVLPNPPPTPRTGPPHSLHATAKKWHRMSVLSGYQGDLLEIVNALIGLALFAMIVTGLTLYFQLLRARRRAGLTSLFWAAGGIWRSLHRGVSLVAAIFLLVVSISGALLSIDTVALGVYGATHIHAGRFSRFPRGMTADLSSPLPDEKVAVMLATTLSAYHQANGDLPIKVLRLRYFSGMPQGVILTGGEETHQVVYNADTGKSVGMTEPSYPYSGFPFGWEEHELMKKIHRGDAFGLPGRLLDVFAGLSLVFLSASGMWMYIDLVRRRSRAGNVKLFWA